MRFIESPQFYLSMDRDSDIYEDFSPWRARTPIKPTKPKTSIPQKPAECPAQPDPRMPLLKERARLLSELQSATGLFISFKKMRLKREIRAVEDKLAIEDKLHDCSNYVN